MQHYDRFSDHRPHNPFATPRARVDDPASPGSGALLDPPRGVETGRGFAWFGEGYRLFREAPGTWVGAVLVWLLLNFALGFIPGAGNLINPVLLGGLLFGCHTLATGGAFRLEHLFQGFRQNFGTLLLIGLLGVVGTLVIIAIGILVLLAAGLGSILLNPQAAAGLDQAAMGLVLVAVLAVLALSVPLAMAFWFAPALAILHDLPALGAIGLSFRGCLRNLLPFLAYGLAGLGLGILASLPLFLGWLVLMPVLFTSTYAAYRDIFLE